jgi:hypothetical protein
MDMKQKAVIFILSILFFIMNLLNCKLLEKNSYDKNGNIEKESNKIKNILILKPKKQALKNRETKDLALVPNFFMFKQDTFYFEFYPAGTKIITFRLMRIFGNEVNELASWNLNESDSNGRGEIEMIHKWESFLPPQISRAPINEIDIRIYLHSEIGSSVKIVEPIGIERHIPFKIMGWIQYKIMEKPVEIKENSTHIIAQYYSEPAIDKRLSEKIFTIEEIKKISRENRISFCIFSVEWKR